MEDSTPMTWSHPVLVCLDALVVVLSYLVVLVARFAGSVPLVWSDRFWAFVVPVAAGSVLVNHLFGAYGPERRPSRALVAGLVTAAAVIVLTNWTSAVPRSVALGGGVLSALGFAGLRLTGRSPIR